MTVSQATNRVLGVERLAPGIFVLRFERKGLKFETGQYLSLGLPGLRKEREYSIYSGEADPELSVLVKEVPSGEISPQLAKLKPGDALNVSGPFGYFLLRPTIGPGYPLLWIATGTGISPFRSFARSLPETDYVLLHGTRSLEETVLSSGFARSQTVSCVSGSPGGTYHGRVTGYLSTMELSPLTRVFLCGNCDMIYDAFDLLQAKGIPAGQIFTEVYY
ncbi:MAG: FAD-binding oxidoreductase [Spirochaetales bacterium]